MTDRNATVIWEGDLPSGKGTLTTQSGAISGASVTWASRVEAPEGKTSPEEMLAAAEAECYVMGLSSRLAGMGSTATRLEATATATVEKQDGGLKITRIQLDVRGDVPGIDGQTFDRVAREAEAGCPVSNALRGNVEISLHSELAAASGA